MTYSQLSVALPRDSASRSFVGPSGRIPKGFPDPGNDNEVTPYNILVRADGVTPLFGDPSALADGTSNPTITRLAAYLMGFNGTTWDRIRNTTANGLSVDVTRVGKTALTPTSPYQTVINTSSAQVVPANSARKGLILTNVSGAVVSLAFNAAAVLYNGITLYPSGVFTMDEYTFTTLEVRGIASVASSAIAVQEFQ